MLHTNAKWYLWVFLKKQNRQNKKKQKKTLWDEKKLLFHLCPSHCSWNEQIGCTRVLLQRNVQVCFNTSSHPLHCLLHVGSVMHVIDCSRWPETSTRLTSAGNYWPPLIVSQRCWGVYVCACTSVCHIFTINRLLPPVFGSPWYCPKGKITSNLWTSVVYTHYITKWRCHRMAYHWL